MATREKNTKKSKKPLLVIGLILGIAALGIGGSFFITRSIVLARDLIALFLLGSVGTGLGVGVSKGIGKLINKSSDKSNSRSRELTRQQERAQERTESMEEIPEQEEEEEIEMEILPAKKSTQTPKKGR